MNSNQARQRSKHILWRVVLVGILVCLGLAATSCISPRTEPPPIPSLSEEAWREDLQYLAQELPRRHTDLFHNMTRADFEQAVAELDEAIPSLPYREIIVGMARIVAMAGDSHTALDLFQERTGLLSDNPLRLYWFSDGLRVYRMPKGFGPLQQQHLLGARIVQIGETPIEDACARIATVVSHENDAFLKTRIPDYLSSPQILYVMRIVTDATRVGFDLESTTGVRFEYDVTFMPDDEETEPTSPDQETKPTPTEAEVEPSPPGEGPEPTTPAEIVQEKLLDLGKGTQWITAAELRGAPVPLYRQRENEDYWFTYLEDSRTVYFRYSACRHIRKRFVRNLLACVDKHPVDRFIFDLRDNGGGVFPTLTRLIAGLERRPHVTQRGRLFVIVNQPSASAAVVNAALLRERIQALIVGEPTAGKPNAFGNPRKLTLPNSRLVVTCSTIRVEKTQETGATLVPDIGVDYTFEDYANGRDPALEAILQYTPEPDTDDGEQGNTLPSS